MEENIVKQPEELLDAEMNIEKKMIKNKINPILVLAVLIVINLVLIIIVFNKNSKLSDAIISMEGKLNDTVNNFNAQSNTVNDLNSKLGIAEIIINQLKMSKTVDGNVVTDQFYVSRSIFKNDGAFIELSIQPTIALEYEGYGNFSIDDRELKKYLLELVAILEERYDFNKLDSMKAFKELQTQIVVSNYSIATLNNGELVLSGE